VNILDLDEEGVKEFPNRGMLGLKKKRKKEKKKMKRK